MITDSVPWKMELLKMADSLDRRAHLKRWTERSAFLVERDVMLGAYAIRKLLDTPGKISDEVRESRIPVSRHPLTTRPPDFWSIYELWEHYDLEHGTPQTLSLRDFCNQIVHSFGWLLAAGEEGAALDGFFVCSDRESLKSAIYVDLRAVTTAFRNVGADDVVHLEMRRNDSGQMQVVKASRFADMSALSSDRR